MNDKLILIKNIPMKLKKNGIGNVCKMPLSHIGSYNSSVKYVE